VLAPVLQQSELPRTANSKLPPDAQPRREVRTSSNEAAAARQSSVMKLRLYRVTVVS
jgi:hypothetical protein